MRTVSRTLLALALLCATPALFAQAVIELPSDAESQATAHTSKALVGALQSGDLAQQEAAMQAYIAHPSLFDIRAAKFDVVRLYRDHAESNVRILALATLYAMQEGWTMDFLLRSIDFERDERIQRLTRYVAYSYHYPDLVQEAPPALAAVIR